MTTTTLSVNDTSSSYCIYTDSSSYSTARNASSGTVYGDLCAMNNKTSTYQVYRGFYYFNTSTLPLGAIIVSATIRLTYTNFRQIDHNDTLYLVTHTANTTIQSTDFPKVGSTQLFASPPSFSSFTANVPVTFALNAAGLAAITKKGITKLAVRAGQDVSNTTPSNVGGIQFTKYGMSNPPLLTINYYLPSGGSIMRAFL